MSNSVLIDRSILVVCTRVVHIKVVRTIFLKPFDVLGRFTATYSCLYLIHIRQALHTLEDFAAHSNYTELALRELGYNNVFPHVGSGTEIHVRGKRIYPLTTGTFGGLDFVVSVL
jgi:hypothetical protein